MEKTYITKEQQKLFRKFLSKNDIIAVAEESGFKTSTVSDVIKMIRPIHKNNEEILKNLNIACYTRMLEDRELITPSLKKLRKLPEVRVYNNLNDGDKWI